MRCGSPGMISTRLLRHPRRLKTRCRDVRELLQPKGRGGSHLWPRLVPIDIATSLSGELLKDDLAQRLAVTCQLCYRVDVGSRDDAMSLQCSGL